MNGRQTHGRDANEKVHIATRTRRKNGEKKNINRRKQAKIANEIERGHGDGTKVDSPTRQEENGSMNEKKNG